MLDLTYTAVAEPEAFVERLKQVPHAPGVYQWKDASGALLYVGKSKHLYNRMRSYFGAPRGLNAKTRRMVSQIADFEIIVTRSELEALLLEMNLIKQHRPRYNILLKDDKSYPYIKVTLQEEWPRVFSTRHVVNDGSRYFGPYASGGSVRTALTLLNRLFAFRPFYECKDEKFNRHRRMGKPCLYYDMKRCLGPCVPGLVDQDEYRHAIESVCRFLEGKSDQIVRDLRSRMEQAADELNFERAAYLRDQIRAIEKVREQQQVLRTVDTDQDVVAFAREEGSAVVQVFFIRGGKLIGAEPFVLQGTEDEQDSALITSFLTQFYDRAPDVPPNLLLAEHIEEPMIIEQWLAEKRGHRVQLEVPRRGEKRRLVEMAANNAQQKLNEMRFEWLNQEERTLAALNELRDILELPDIPRRIECYDVSNTQGHQSVASMVVFEQGTPKTGAYRRFKIQTVDGANDVASIREVIRRRFKRAITHRKKQDGGDDAPDQATSNSASAAWAELPDLVLIDGGRGQLNAAREGLHELGVHDILVVGVAKGVDRNRFDLVHPDYAEPFVLPRESKALHLVQQIDEEAHRFAITYHRKLRDRTAFASPLDEISGIGPKRKRALLKRFGSIEGIRRATAEEVAAVPGMTRKVADELKELIG